MCWISKYITCLFNPFLTLLQKGSHDDFNFDIPGGRRRKRLVQGDERQLPACNSHGRRLILHLWTCQAAPGAGHWHRILMPLISCGSSGHFFFLIWLFTISFYKMLLCLKNGSYIKFVCSLVLKLFETNRKASQFTNGILFCESITHTIYYGWLFYW